jgi:hypothetical protein
VKERTPEPEAPQQFKAFVLQRLAPPIVTVSGRVARISSRKDQLALYLKEPLTDILLLEYWLSKETQWPQLAKMAIDFLCIPAISSEYKRVFSSCSKQTTPHSSRLSGELLWHKECLKNWQRRGHIKLMSCWNAIFLGDDF